MTTPSDPPPPDPAPGPLPGQQPALPPRPGRTAGPADPAGQGGSTSGADRPGPGAGWLFLIALLAGALGAALAIVVVDQLGQRTSDSERSTPDRSAEPDGSGGDHEPVQLAAPDPPSEDALAAAVSQTREDSVYPEVGDPVVDALHYAIDFAWFPESSDEFAATTTVTFRATESRDDFTLDLAETITVSSVALDGTEVGFEHDGKDLVVDAAVALDQRYAVTVAYAGPPEPTEAPTTRSDFDGVGLTRSGGDYEGWLWTMQEPYGAFTWYPVNDQPADKAFYDITVRTAPGWSGVANGVVSEQGENDDEFAIRFHADAPQPSYLTTIAVGEYEFTEDVSASGVPLYYWTPAHDDATLDDLRATKDLLASVEDLLGPYPFSSLGSVVVDSQSAMETQTMITYGNTAYTLSPGTIVHEIAHHWYGNQVSPADWSDVWMNEGMATYLQVIAETEETGGDLDTVMRQMALEGPALRADAGPPGAYDPDRFAESNIYVLPAIMWHELRHQVGDEAFWPVVRAWPSHADGAVVSTDRETYVPWISERLDTDLTSFFTAWLIEQEQPEVTF